MSKSHTIGIDGHAPIKGVLRGWNVVVGVDVDPPRRDSARDAGGHADGVSDGPLRAGVDPRRTPRAADDAYRCQPDVRVALDRVVDTWEEDRRGGHRGGGWRE